MTKTFFMQLCMHWGQMLVSERPMTVLIFNPYVNLHTCTKHEWLQNEASVSVRVLYANLHKNRTSALSWGSSDDRHLPQMHAQLHTNCLWQTSHGSLSWAHVNQIRVDSNTIVKVEFNLGIRFKLPNAAHSRPPEPGNRLWGLWGLVRACAGLCGLLHARS